MKFDEFKKKVTADKEFAEKFAGVKSVDEMIRLAAAEGFTITEDDIRNSAKVTDADLEKAAGGGFITNGGSWVDFSTSIVKITSTVDSNTMAVPVSH
ncbi:MAG: Nif11-like leader peptide family RiPP precursor [Clostridia bacterium]|nr:Nif11-like leader peptide family RiPP precursor [Clostridia bacterium]